VLFGFSDYTLFGFSAMFFGLAGLRLAVVAGTAGALFFLRHVRNPPVFDVVLTVWGLAVGAFVLFVNWTRPASFHGQIALDVLCVVLAYVALPLPLPRQMLLAGLFTVGNLLLFFLVKAPQGSMTVTVVVAAQVLANAAGILVSCSVKTRKRQLFAAYLREQQLRANLVKALAEVRTLRGLLPICATCKRVRDEEGGWQCVEIYVRDRTHADFTHSICPVCMTEALQDLKR